MSAASAAATAFSFSDWRKKTTVRVRLPAAVARKSPRKLLEDSAWVRAVFCLRLRSVHRRQNGTQPAREARSFSKRNRTAWGAAGGESQWSLQILCGDECYASSFALKECVCPYRGAVEHNYLLRITCDLIHRFRNGLRRIGWRGKYLEDLERRSLKPNTSVKVPPLSMAILRGVRVDMNGDSETRDSNMRNGHSFLPMSNPSIESR